MRSLVNIPAVCWASYFAIRAGICCSSLDGYCALMIAESATTRPMATPVVFMRTSVCRWKNWMTEHSRSEAPAHDPSITSAVPEIMCASNCHGEVRKLMIADATSSRELKKKSACVPVTDKIFARGISCWMGEIDLSRNGRM